MTDEFGTLYVVATPIGNLGDITIRAIEILKEVELILCEDTRVSRKLFQKFEVDTNILSYRDQNHKRVLPQVTDLLLKGKDIALISDAGTPLISDPGFKLVEYVYEIGASVISIPGPSSVISALSSSGLPTDRFLFLGFPPKSEGKLRTLLQKEMDSDNTLVLFESPFRIKKLMRVISEIDPLRIVSVVNDQTKMYEKIWRGKSSEILEQLEELTKPKGEFVVLIAKEKYSIS